MVEENQPNLQSGNNGNKSFRSSVSVVTLTLFVLAIATFQILSVVILETPQSVYGQTQATVTANNNNIVRDLSWRSPWYDNNLKPTTSNVITIAASVSDNANNNNTPFVLPSPSSSQSFDNNSSPPAVGPTSNTSPSNNSVNSNSPSQGDNSNNGNSTNTHHVDQSNSHSNTVSSSNNHVQDQHKKHTNILHKAFGRSMQQFTGGEIPFP